MAKGEGKGRHTGENMGEVEYKNRRAEGKGGDHGQL